MVEIEKSGTYIPVRSHENRWPNGQLKDQNPNDPSFDVGTKTVGCTLAEEDKKNTKLVKGINTKTKEIKKARKRRQGILTGSDLGGRKILSRFIRSPYIVDWIAYDIILGKSWLTSVNPMIDWTRNRMRIKNKTPDYISGRRVSWAWGIPHI